MTTSNQIIGPLSWKTGRFSLLKYSAITLSDGTLGIKKLAGSMYLFIPLVVGILIVHLLLRGGALPALIFIGGGWWVGQKWGKKKAGAALENQDAEDLVMDPDIEVEAADIVNLHFKERSLWSSTLRVKTRSDDYTFYGDATALESAHDGLQNTVLDDAAVQ